jgi:NAD(P)-dependent dehydrogenase (short-subunit alcohol dehydrogenase family)
MPITIDLEGRIILVCGTAQGGIGAATARRLAEAGAVIVGVDRTKALLDATAAELAGLGYGFHGLPADLTDPAQTDPIVAEVVRRFGRLDGVVNIAGGTTPGEWGPLEETSTGHFRDSLNLNLEYVFRICRDAARWMIGSGTSGAIVNVGSVSGLTSAPFHGPYGAAKSAVAALTRTMALEWWRYGIRANTVSPGAVTTERVLARIAGREGLDSRFSAPQQIADTILFLLSDLASAISGQNVVVDSSLSARYSGLPTIEQQLTTPADPK